MLVNDIIQLSRIPETNFRSLIQQSLNHALWHYVLFFDETDDIEKGLLCLLKESLAKLLFRFFCMQNNLPIEFNVQNGDRFLSFLLKDKNWELITLSVDGLPIKMASETISLPAMIPSQKLDSSEKDEFGNTIIRWTSNVDKQVLFTYLHNNSSDKSFIELSLPVGLEQLYKDFFKLKKRGKSLHESDFWKKLKPIGAPDFLIHHKPDFYITAWAGSKHWKFFYALNSSAFPNIETITSENKTVFVHRLPAFSQLFPHLNEAIHFGKFLN